MSQKKWSQESQKKVVKPNDLAAKVDSIRKEKKSIVTINGSFDLLHSGHLQILYEASLLADVFIAALNSDLSIKQYKSPTRPIIPLQYRLQMMAAISFIDYITYFDELTPIRFLEIVKPDIHVNGAEYGENCIEADTVKKNGGKLHIVSLVEGLSTSNIIEKIQACEF